MVISKLTLILIGSLAAFLAFMAVLVIVGKVPISYSIRNLVVRWRTTLLTAVAFMLVVSLLTVMLAFVNGMYRLTEGSSQPGNVMVLQDGATDELFSNLGYGSDVRNIERAALKDDESGEYLASWEVYIVVNQKIENAKPGERQRRFVQVRGLNDGVIAGKVHNLRLYPGGQFFSQAGVEETGKGENLIQADIGEGIARELGKDQNKASLAIGDTFSLGDRTWVVTGIMQSAGSTFDSEVWAKRDLVGKKFGKENPSTCVIRTENATTAAATAKDLTANFKDSAVQAQVESEYYDKLNATNQQFLFAIIIVTIIIAIGGVFGVMNTMFAAISQRTKDIGVLRIIGFAGWQVLISFFLESLFLALLGGLLGCAVGFLANGWTASSIVGSGQGGGKSVVLKLVVDAKILSAGLIISLLMGTIGGLVPAFFAMRVKPLDSLR